MQADSQGRREPQSFTHEDSPLSLPLRSLFFVPVARGSHSSEARLSIFYGLLSICFSPSLPHPSEPGLRISHLHLPTHHQRHLSVSLCFLSSSPPQAGLHTSLHPFPTHHQRDARPPPQRFLSHIQPLLHPLLRLLLPRLPAITPRPAVSDMSG